MRKDRARLAVASVAVAACATWRAPTALTAGAPAVWGVANPAGRRHAGSSAGLSRCRPQLAAKRRKKGGAAPKAKEPPFISFDDVPLTEPLGHFQEEQLGEVVNSLLLGGMGVIPTDTHHAYVTCLSNRKGVQRIYEAKGVSLDERKPLSLLCADMSMVSSFVEMAALPRRWFQLLRSCLPGPYTFIMQATRDVPKVILEHKSRRRLWVRREVGVRVPDCAVVQYLAQEVGEPLLASSACDGPLAVWEEEKHSVDFIVAGSHFGSEVGDIAEEDRISTIVDLTMEEPVLRRQGIGDASMFEGV